MHIPLTERETHIFNNLPQCSCHAQVKHIFDSNVNSFQLDTIQTACIRSTQNSKSHTCRKVTLFDLQLDAQNSCLFTYNTFIKLLYIFRALPCSSSGGLRRNCIYAASGIVTVCRCLSCAPVHKTITCRQ